MKHRLHVSIIFCLLIILCAAFIPPAFADVGANELQVHVFSAGKADAYLVYTDEHAVLIDTGLRGFGKDIVKYLQKKDIPKLDALIITHFDKDHVGGAAKVLESIPVSRVLQSNCPQESDEYNAYLEALSTLQILPETLRETCSFSLDGVDYTIYPPKRESYNSDESNNSSLATAVRFGDTGILFTGDSESARINELCSIGIGAFDALQIPHHGDWYPELERLIEGTKPKLAFISSSSSEPEDARTLNLLESAGIDVYLSRNEKVNIHSDGSTLWVK